MRLHRLTVAAAGALAAFLAVLIAIGATSFDVTGYGGGRELAIAVALLVGSLLLYAYRRVVQDGDRLRLRERPEP